MNTFALKGEVKVSIDTDFVSERYKKGSTVYILDSEGYRPFVVEHYRSYKGNLIVKFKDHDDINDIERYKGNDIYKAKADIEPLADGGYYFNDLIGLDVYDDKKLGEVIDVEEGVRYNLLRVKKIEGGVSLIPFIPVFIQDVDLKEKRIYIKMIEGLL